MNYEEWDSDLSARDEEAGRSKFFWFVIGLMGGMLLLAALLRMGILVMAP